MKKANRFFKIMLFALCIMQSILLTLPAQAANRNDFLFNLKDTFNSPASGKISIVTILFLVCGAAIVWAIKYNSTREQQAQRTSHEMYKQKVSSQKTSNPQKRNWFRMKTSAEFKWIPAELAPNTKESKYRVDRLIDVSGGGLSFSTSQEIYGGDDIKVIVFLGEGNPLPLDAQVVRVLPDEEGVNSVSTKFIGLRDGQRDRIISWILQNQRATNYNSRFEDKSLHPEDEYESAPSSQEAATKDSDSNNEG